MREFLFSLLLTVITAVVLVLTTYGTALLKKAVENAAAKTNDIKAQRYLAEIENAISNAVLATSQTYVDTLKKSGKFDKEAQENAAKNALIVCANTISPAAMQFLEKNSGSVVEYMTSRIEAEVRRQKIELTQ